MLTNLAQLGVFQQSVDDTREAEIFPRRAASALPRLDGHLENMQFEGKPMWHSYLSDVDTVLESALSAEEWERIKAEGPV